MKRVLMLFALVAATMAASAQIESPVRWSYAAKKLNDKEAVIFLKATIQDGWHIYSLNVKDGGPIKTSFTFSPSKEYSILGAPTEPTAITRYEKAFSMDVSYFEKSVIFQQKIKLKSAKDAIVKGKVEYMTCNDKKCLPPDDIDFSIPLGK
jgi:DsbC/DsbD-like thiol-disulfide interchange protein